MPPYNVCLSSNCIQYSKLVLSCQAYYSIIACELPSAILSPLYSTEASLSTLDFCDYCFIVSATLYILYSSVSLPSGCSVTSISCYVSIVSNAVHIVNRIIAFCVVKLTTILGFCLHCIKEIQPCQALFFIIFML